MIYEEGIIEAISYDAQNREIARNVLYTAGKETILTGIPEEKETEAGKLCFVRLQYTDKTGTVKPLKRGTLEVHVENGELLGLETDARTMSADIVLRKQIRILERLWQWFGPERLARLI